MKKIFTFEGLSFSFGDVFFGFTLYIFSCGIIPIYYLLLWVISYLLFYGITIDKNITISTILTIILASVINQSVGILNNNIPINLIDLLPYSILIFFIIISAKKIRKSIFFIFVLLVIIEILVGLIQKKLGVISFYSNNYLLPEDNFLYNKRVYGLSTNSSGFASKIFLSLIIYYYNDFRKNLNVFFFISIVFTGLLITFNRTMLIGVSVFLLINIISLKKKSLKYSLLILLSILIFLLVFTENIFIELLQIQFTRGSSDITNMLSERDIIYPYYLNFIKENLFFGNNSFKLLITMDDGRILHAHNSYLQTFATNGVFIFILYINLIIFNLRRSNYKYIIPFLFVSFFQTYIFWGLSVQDIFFYFILLHAKYENIKL